MRDTVLILAPEEDVHANAVAARLREAGARAVVWDSSSLPANSMASLRVGDELRLELVAPRANLSSASLLSVWSRRPGLPEITPTVLDPRVRRYCAGETLTFLRGALGAIGVPIVNDPTAEAAATRKPLQLRVAEEVGLHVPRTLMSNDPEAVLGFHAELNGRCVYKTFRPPSWQLAETRTLREEDLADLGKLRHAPLIVQERVDGLDIRATVFGDRVFGAALSGPLPPGVTDWKVDLDARWDGHDLPFEVEHRLVELVRRLGIASGCIDLRRQADGDYTFFEVNPSGQFLFVEHETGQPLTQALADLLLSPVPRCGQRSPSCVKAPS